MKLATRKGLLWTDGENERVASFIYTIYNFYLYLPTISPIEQLYNDSNCHLTSNRRETQFALVLYGHPPVASLRPVLAGSRNGVSPIIMHRHPTREPKPKWSAVAAWKVQRLSQTATMTFVLA